MSDSMDICLNDTCFPRTLGSEDNSLLASCTPDVTLVGILEFFGTSIGTSVMLCLKWFGLKVWFTKYKLKYFTRMNAYLFAAISLLDTLHAKGIVTHKEYHIYSPILWNYSVIATLVMLFVRYHWKLPLDITKPFYEVGLTEHRRNNAIVRDRMRRLNMLLDLPCFPPCFPNSWIPIIESMVLHPGQVQGVDVLGRRFCVFLAEGSGEHFVMDAYCPHLGADLTVGGVVRGSCIECPFHGWYVDGRDGSCSRGPGKNPNKQRPEVPPNAKVAKWHSCNANGFIYVWHHAESDKQEPTWEMPRVEEICNGTWIYRGRTEHTVRCHIQEIPENGADINHLEQLHSASVLLGCNWMDAKSWVNIVNHQWEPEWRKDESRPHIAKIRLIQKTTLFDVQIPLGTLDIEIEQIGATVVHMHIKSFFGRGILIQNIIPVGPLTMKVIHNLYTEPALKPFWADLFIRAEAIMLERDIVVWNNKRYLKNPVLLKDEKNIKKYRKWYKQFYSANSPTVSDINYDYQTGRLTPCNAL